MKRSEVLKLRKIIETAIQSVDDTTALEAVALHPEWSAGISYSVGLKVRHGGILYRCLSEHTAQGTWAPNVATSMWAKVLVLEDGTILAWEQPDSTNPYMIGNKVFHNGKTWVSDIDNNVWEPGVYGWTEIV